MNKKMAKTLALISGLLMLLTGLIAFVPNPIIGQGALLGRFAPIPTLYGALGVLLLLISLGGEREAAFGLYGIGASNLLTSIAAYSQVDRSGTASLTGGLRMAQSDILFVAVLGLLFILFGKMNTARKQLFH